jgi:crotonobetainyl-CoA:carnitine CoA-transferase CaiB-like acyl-CoA transferase
MTQSNGSFLPGVRVLELADELGEYCGKLLAGLGADVVKIEPPGGEKTRSYGPFYGDEPHPNRSIYFWHYNFGKRGIVLDLDSDDDRQHFARLGRAADVLIDTRGPGYLADRDLGYEQLSRQNPGLIYLRISPFGDDGPWASYAASDLVHLALGGVMMNCGYDPMPGGTYDTPPVAPQMWQSYQIAGEVSAIAVMGALQYRLDTGRGQCLSTSVHDAVAKNTETDAPDWVYSAREHRRLTCRHSFPVSKPDDWVGGSMAGIAMTKDGRWIFPYRTYLPGATNERTTSELLGIVRKYPMDDLIDEKLRDPEYLKTPEAMHRVNDLIDKLISSYTYERDLWLDGQNAGFAWAPLRRPEENLDDEHWTLRETFVDVEYPELGKTFRQGRAKWTAPGLPWRTGPRAPLLGEHTVEVLAEPDRVAPAEPVIKKAAARPISKRGKPFPLAGVRVIDFGWILASAGAGRFFTSLGAEVIKVEHTTKLDMMRGGRSVPPDGLRAERDRATGPIVMPMPTSLNRSGNFMEINSGKRALSLNLKHDRGKEILTALLRIADIVVEGYSPGTMDRMGFGWEAMRQINPRLIYAQQSAMGQVGKYGRTRSYGPTAQAFSGISEMSGLPEPYPPAGIGYSYLDWFGAYQLATAMMAGLYRQRLTGEGCWIDSSQVETGIYLTGPTILDYTANGRRWSRYGNRSPHKPAAPCGAYRCAGRDRWIAITAFTQEQWLALTRVLRMSLWANDPRLATLALRLQNQDYLDALMTTATEGRDAFELMKALQEAGVPAGVCETSQDRYEWDPQLRHLEWVVELEQTELGRWPVKELSTKFSETPPYIGGAIDRHGPNYGEDNDYVLGELLGLDKEEIDELAKEGVL